MRKPGERLPLRERAELARQAFEFHQRGMLAWEIAIRLKISEPTAVNLIGYGRRLAAGQPEQMEWR